MSGTPDGQDHNLARKSVNVLIAAVSAGHNLYPAPFTTFDRALAGSRRFEREPRPSRSHRIPDATAGHVRRQLAAGVLGQTVADLLCERGFGTEQCLQGLPQAADGASRNNSNRAMTVPDGSSRIRNKPSDGPGEDSMVRALGRSRTPGRREASWLN